MLKQLVRNSRWHLRLWDLHVWYLLAPPGNRGGGSASTRSNWPKFYSSPPKIPRSRWCHTSGRRGLETHTLTLSGPWWYFNDQKPSRLFGVSEANVRRTRQTARLKITPINPRLHFPWGIRPKGISEVKCESKWPVVLSVFLIPRKSSSADLCGWSRRCKTGRAPWWAGQEIHEASRWDRPTQEDTFHL